MERFISLEIGLRLLAAGKEFGLQIGIQNYENGFKCLARNGAVFCVVGFARIQNTGRLDKLSRFLLVCYFYD